MRLTYHQLSYLIWSLWGEVEKMDSNNSVTKMMPSQPLSSGKVSEVQTLGKLSRISLSSVIFQTP